MPSSLKAQDRAEDAVRAYLVYLNNPEDLIDQHRVAKAQQRVDRSAGDVVEHLKALAALDQAKIVDGAPLREAFVAVVAEWAADHKISVDRLRDFHVPDAVLVEAKMLSKKQFEQGRAAANRARTRRPPTPKTQAEAPDEPAEMEGSTNGHSDLDEEHVAMLIEGMPPPGTSFTVAGLAEKTGLTKNAARMRVNRAHADGLIVPVGLDPDTTKPGRQPMQYTLATDR